MGGVEGGQLRQGNGHLPALPADQHAPVAGAGIFGSQAPDFDSFLLDERRNHLGNDTLRLERESDFVLQVLIPAQGLLLRSLSVNHNLVVDSLLPDGVSLGFGHGSSKAASADLFCRSAALVVLALEHRCNPAMSRLRRPSGGAYMVSVAMCANLSEKFFLTLCSRTHRLISIW